MNADQIKYAETDPIDKEEDEQDGAFWEEPVAREEEGVFDVHLAIWAAENA